MIWLRYICKKRVKKGSLFLITGKIAQFAMTKLILRKNSYKNKFTFQPLWNIFRLN